MCTFFF